MVINLFGISNHPRWHRPVIPTLRRLRQEGFREFISLGCIVRPCLKTDLI